MCKAWEGFTAGAWQSRIDVRDFIQKNYTPYGGDEAFLAPATPRTQALMHKLQGLMKLEQEFGGVLDVDTQTVSSLLNYKPGYLDKDNELIVGLQTDRPLKRGVNPFGGIRMAREACRAYGYELSGQVEQEFAYRTTHNDGVFRAYSQEMKKARHLSLITGLPDAYGRGRIIGDYRRVALYGIDYLIAKKQADKSKIDRGAMGEEEIRLCEELYQQIAFLNKTKEMAFQYGFDIFFNGKRTKNRGFLRQIRNTLTGTPMHGLMCQALFIDIDFAAIGRHQADNHVKTSGLTGTVRAK